MAEGRRQSDTDQSGDLYLTPGFWRRYGPDLASGHMDLAVQLQRGFADEVAFDETVVGRFGDRANLAVVGGRWEEEPALLAGVQRAIAFETLALLLFAVLALLSMVLLVSQTLGRQVFLAATQDPILRALGMTRRQLVGVALVRAALIGAGVQPLPWPPRWRCPPSPRSGWPAWPSRLPAWPLTGRSWPSALWPSWPWSPGARRCRPGERPTSPATLSGSWT